MGGYDPLHVFLRGWDRSASKKNESPFLWLHRVWRRLLPGVLGRVCPGTEGQHRELGQERLRAVPQRRQNLRRDVFLHGHAGGRHPGGHLQRRNRAESLEGGSLSLPAPAPLPLLVIPKNNISVFFSFSFLSSIRTGRELSICAKVRGVRGREEPRALVVCVRLRSLGVLSAAAGAG